MNSLGIRIINQQWRFALVSHTKNSWRVIESGTIEPNADQADALIRQAKRIILGISASDVMTKIITQPLDYDYFEVIPFIASQLSHWFGQPASVLSFDCFPIKKTAHEQYWQVVATRHSILQRYYTLLPRLHFTAIDVDVFALMRMLPPIIQTDSYIFVSQTESESLIFSVKNGFYQRRLVVKKRFLSPHIEALRQDNEPVFISSELDKSLHYIDCIGLALWNKSI